MAKKMLPSAIVEDNDIDFNTNGEKNSIAKHLAKAFDTNSNAKKKLVATILTEMYGNDKKNKNVDFIRIDDEDTKEELKEKLEEKKNLKENRDYLVVNRKIKSKANPKIIKDKFILLAPQKKIKQIIELIEEEIALDKKKKRERAELSMQELLQLAEMQDIKVATKFKSLNVSTLNYIRNNANNVDLKFTATRRVRIDGSNSEKLFDVSVVGKSNERKMYGLMAEAMCLYGEKKLGEDGLSIGKQLSRLSERQYEVSKQIRNLLNNANSLENPVTIIAADRFSRGATGDKLIYMTLSQRGLEIVSNKEKNFIPISNRDELKKQFFITQDKMGRTTILEGSDKGQLNQLNNKELNEKYSLNPKEKDSKQIEQLQKEAKMIRKIMAETDVSSTKEALAIVELVKSHSAKIDRPGFDEKVINQYEEKSNELYLARPDDFNKSNGLETGITSIHQDLVGEVAKVSIDLVGTEELKMDPDFVFQKETQEVTQEVAAPQLQQQAKPLIGKMGGR